MSTSYSELTGDDDGLPDDNGNVNDTPFRFLDLPLEIQSHAVDYPDLIGMTQLKATCKSLRALPTVNQERSALIEFEEELEEAWTLFEEHDDNGYGGQLETKRRTIMYDVRRWVQRRPAWDDYYSGYYQYGQSNKSDGTFSKWMALAAEYGIDPFHAKWAAIASLDQFHCFGCFRVKQSDGFDMSQFGNAYWEYRRHSLSQVTFKEAVLEGVGWLKSMWDDYYIRCAVCLEYEEFKKAFSYRMIDSDGGQEETRGYEDLAICHRMFQGDLCQACFEEEYADWFAFREHLLAEIEAKMKYLDWMISKDDKPNDEPPPTEDVVPYWQ
ncbi:hypothetical protein H2200_003868 [Cladophialophora chaetospira]|uniref:F-box domain-containing protein n=1 Tax=Cladophialophora chaetospira TaxID=386627 RepID=A0AA38XFP1_9EURO|nr:hypothetical protein H2200_003868 [Cladophialophora chaetospira]